MDPKKKQEIISLDVPNDEKALYRFMGMVNQNAIFIPKLAEIAALLTTLNGTTEPWRWSTSCQLAFEQVKEAVSKASYVTYIRDDELAPENVWPEHRSSQPKIEEESPQKGGYKHLFSQTDASDIAVSAILTIGQEWWYAEPTAWYSRKLSGPQMKYTMPEKKI